MTSVVDSSFSFKDIAADSAATSFDDDADVVSEGATVTCSTVIDGKDDVVVFSISNSAVDSEEGGDDADDDEVDGFIEAAAAAAASEQLSSVAGLSTGNDSGLIAKD